MLTKGLVGTTLMDTRVAASSVFAEKASTAMKQSRTAKEGEVRKRFIVFSPVDLGAETSGVRRHYHKARHKFSTDKIFIRCGAKDVLIRIVKPFIFN